MGVVLWAAGGLVAFALVRLIPHGRPDGMIAEALIAVIGAMMLGVVATYLDFGGWREVDWRAPLFAACGSLALLGLGRLTRLARRLDRI
jgi:uncharacterized membrane protein YeaQ/YmgE (transglycosylase-associated protein family)